MTLKRLVPILIVLAMLGGAYYFWHQSRLKQQGASPTTLYGTIDMRQVSLAFNGSDRIAALEVEEGQSVSPGQVLGRLDTSTLDLQVSQAQAQLEAQKQMLQRLKAGSRPEEIAQSKASVLAAEAEATLAQKQLARLQAVHAASEQHAVSRTELDMAEAQVKATQAKLEVAKKSRDLTVIGPRTEDIANADAQTRSRAAELALLQKRQQDALLKAPVAGIVRSRLMEVGDMANPQRPVFTIALTEPKWVRAYIPEPDLPHIRPDQSVSVVVDGIANAFPGKIGYISSVAEFTPKTVQTEDLRTSLVYEVRVFVQDPAGQLKLGMPVTVRLDGNVTK